MSNRHKCPGTVLARAAAALMVATGLLAGTNAGTSPAWARPVITPGDLQRLPNAGRLLAALTADEGQLAGALAYARARTYLRQAEVRELAAARSVEKASVVLRLDQIRQDLAVLAEVANRVVVGEYHLALYQVGMAEYTGIVNVPSGIDFASLQTRLEDSEVAQVTGADTAAALGRARLQVSLSAAFVSVAQRATGLALAALSRAVGRLRVSEAKVNVAAGALAAARRWATVPGAAPLRPAQRLAVLERGVSPPSKKRSRAPMLVHAATLSVGPHPVRPRTAKPQPGPGSRPDQGPSILGPALLSASDVEGWYASTGSRPNTSVPLPKLVRDYFAAARQVHVRPDLAFAQSIVETGYFSFPPGGQLKPSDNNFAGIGACDSCAHGWSFPSPFAGVLAQEQLLRAYASPRLSASSAWLSGLGVQGCCRTWLSLSGIWASNLSYGYEILSVYKHMVDWVLKVRLQAEGLATAASASLPAQKPATTGPNPNFTPGRHAGAVSQREAVKAS
jgi:hypothetical protein